MLEINSANNIGDGGSADWLDACLILRSDLNFDIRKRNQQTFAVIEDPIRSRFFQIGQDEYRIISRIDGRRTIRQILELTADDELGPVSAELAQSVCNWLVANNFLLMNGEQLIQRLQTAAKSKQTSKTLARLNPICIKFKICNPDRILTKLTPGLRGLFSLPMVLLWLAVGAFAISQLTEQWSRFSSSAVGILAPSRWIWLLLVWVGLKIIHELAHGICCKKYGGEVKEAGALLLLFAPLAYVDVTSSWRMSNRWQRICVSAAGMYVELAVAFVAAILWCQLQPGIWSDLCYNIIIMASLTSLLFNANPLMRFDGYYVLADALNVVNLYNRGRDRVWKWFDKWILGAPTTRSTGMTRESTIVASYGILSTMWKVLLTFTLLLAASVLFNGVGLLLAAVGGVFWVVMPLVMQGRRIARMFQQGQVSIRRLTLAGSALTVLVAITFFVLRAPSVTSAPAIVKHENEQNIRARADGFLVELAVLNGDWVRSGQVLLQLENPELQHEFNSLNSELESAQIQSRVYRDSNELAKWQAEEARIVSFQQKIGEVKAQLDSQRIVADKDGLVFARGLENKIGRFFKQGDLLMTIADDKSKKIVVSISEDDIDNLPKETGGAVQLAIPGMPLVECRLRQFQPRASDRLTETALGASVGGPLPVRPVSENGESELRLIQPRFTAELEVPTEKAKMLFAGQTGNALLKTNSRSLGTYWFVSLQRWIGDKLKQATQTAVQ